MRDLSSAIRFCSSSPCSGLFVALRNGRVSAGIDADGRLQRRRAVHRQKCPFGQRLAHVPPRVERGDDLAGYGFLQRDERIVGQPRAFDPCEPARPSWRPEPSSDSRSRTTRIAAATDAVCCIHSRQRRVDERANHGLRKRAIEREIGLRYAGGGREPALIGRIVAAERSNVVERPGLAPHHPIAGGEIGVGRVPGLALEHRLVETGRQGVDQVDIARELAVLLLCNAAGNEDAQDDRRVSWMV